MFKNFVTFETLLDVFHNISGHTANGQAGLQASVKRKERRMTDMQSSAKTAKTAKTALWLKLLFSRETK
jgi:hypothetical protein